MCFTIFFKIFSLFSLIFRPKNENPINVNFDAIGKSYAANRELGLEDLYVIMRNSELHAGNWDKNHLVSSGKEGNSLYLILRDYGCSIEQKFDAIILKYLSHIRDYRDESCSKLLSKNKHFIGKGSLWRE